MKTNKKVKRWGLGLLAAAAAVGGLVPSARAGHDDWGVSHVAIGVAGDGFALAVSDAGFALGFGEIRAPRRVVHHHVHHGPPPRRHGGHGFRGHRDRGGHRGWSHRGHGGRDGWACR